MFTLKPNLLLLIFFFLIIVSPIDAAEVLQVKTSNSLLIGDQNRNYTVRLACLEVDQLNNDRAKKWLVSQLPRGTKVNLQPRGSDNGVLISNVIRIDKSVEISKGLVDKGFASYTCSSHESLS